MIRDTDRSQIQPELVALSLLLAARVLARPGNGPELTKQEKARLAAQQTNDALAAFGE